MLQNRQKERKALEHDEIFDFCTNDVASILMMYSVEVYIVVVCYITNSMYMSCTFSTHFIIGQHYQTMDKDDYHEHVSLFRDGIIVFICVEDMELNGNSYHRYEVMCIYILYV